MPDIYERKQNEDKAVDGKVALYLFRLTIDGDEYCGQIPAKSWAEAQKLVHPFRGVVDGLLIETLFENVCSICAGEIRIDQTSPVGMTPDDEFPDIIGE